MLSNFVRNFLVLQSGFSHERFQMGECWFWRFCMASVYFYNLHIHIGSRIPAFIYRGISNDHGKLTPELHSRREPLATNSIELIFFLFCLKIIAW